MQPVYQLGNFKTGEYRETTDKDLMRAYVALGFKLITVLYKAYKGK